jgi:hypothetical protein
MPDDSPLKKATNKIKDVIADGRGAIDHAAGAVAGRLGDARDAVGDAFEKLRRRIVGMEVTVYPTYGYRDPADEGAWIVPMRVWVHDNRDTPFVEDLIERFAVRHFEEDLKPHKLTDDEKERLRACLENFIADDKNDESVSFTFAGDAARRPFRFERRTSPNGVIEESVRVPGALVSELIAGREGGGGWLEVEAVTGDGHGAGRGLINFIEPEGLSVVSDIDDTVKITQVPAGKKTVLRNTFLREFKAAAGMRERYLKLGEEAGGGGDVSFHYVSGSPWQLYGLLGEFLIEREQFPPGTFHMKNLRKNLLEPGALESVKAFALGGDLATLDQKVRQITNLMVNLPRRRFILVGDSGERDPEVYRAIKGLFGDRVIRIYIRDVLGRRLDGMELITGDDVPVALDTKALIEEMEDVMRKAAEGGEPPPKL